MDIKIILDGREYHVTDIKMINKEPWAIAYYVHPERGKREVQNWERLKQLGSIVEGTDLRCTSV